MKISRRFMPLLTELGGLEMDFCYKHVAPNGAPAFQHRLFNRATTSLCSAELPPGGAVDPPHLFVLKSAPRSLTVALMAALQFLGKYRETGLLLIRASLGLIFIILIAPVLWKGQGSWEHFGSAMRHLDFHSHYKFWGFLGAVLGCAGGVLMMLGLFFRIGVLFALAVTVVELITVWGSRGDFHARIPALEMSILLLSLLFIGPGKYSVDKS